MTYHTAAGVGWMLPAPPPPLPPPIPKGSAGAFSGNVEIGKCVVDDEAINVSAGTLEPRAESRKGQRTRDGGWVLWVRTTRGWGVAADPGAWGRWGGGVRGHRTRNSDGGNPSMLRCTEINRGEGAFTGVEGELGGNVGGGGLEGPRGIKLCEDDKMR